jgi:hypothetical protein
VLDSPEGMYAKNVLDWFDRVAVSSLRLLFCALTCASSLCSANVPGEELSEVSVISVSLEGLAAAVCRDNSRSRSLLTCPNIISCV